MPKACIAIFHKASHSETRAKCASNNTIYSKNANLLGLNMYLRTHASLLPIYTVM